MMKLRLALLIVTAALVVAGCTSPDSGTPTPTPTPTATPTTTTPTSTTPTPTTSPVDATPTIDSVLVGTDAAYPPFEDTVNGTIVGFDVAVMNEIGRRAGFTVTFQNSAFTAIIPSVQSGQFDLGMSAFSITDERKQQVDFSVAYYENELMAAVVAGNDQIKKAEDLVGKKVCTQIGTTSEAYLRDTLAFTDDGLVLLETAPPCADALKRGDVAAMLIDAAFVRKLIADSEGQLDTAFTVDPQEQFGIVLAKGNTELLVAVNTALQSMKTDGTLQALEDEWQV